MFGNITYQEQRKRIDRYAVAINKNGTVIGHIHRKMRRVCSLFLMTSAFAHGFGEPSGKMT